MASSFQVDIISPERQVMQTTADFVVVPAADGELGILAHHAPLLAELQPGPIRLRRGNDWELFAISGGFLEVRDNKVAIFAETAEMAQEIDAERARLAVERAKAQLQKASDRTDLEIEAALRRALVRLRVVEAALRRPPNLR